MRIATRVTACLAAAMILAVPLAAMAAPPAVGQPAPDFELPIWNSTNTFKLSDYKDKQMVIISFMQMACSNCVVELQKLQEYVGKSKSYVIVAISVDLTAGSDPWNAAMTKYTESRGLTMKFLADPKFKVARSFGFSATPSMVVVGKDGNVMEKKVGYDLESGASEIDALMSKLK